MQSHKRGSNSLAQSNPRNLKSGNRMDIISCPQCHWSGRYTLTASRNASCPHCYTIIIREGVRVSKEALNGRY